MSAGPVARTRREIAAKNLKMKPDDYFEKAAKDPAYRAEEISNTEYLAKFCAWWGGFFFVLWLGLGVDAYLAGERWRNGSMFSGVAIGIFFYGHLRTKSAALRTIDRLTPPA